MPRRTIKDLERLCRDLESAYGFPAGVLFIQGAYGGHEMQIETCSAYSTGSTLATGCGTSDFLETGYVSTGVLYSAARAALAAISKARRGKTLRPAEDSARTFCTRADVDFAERACAEAAKPAPKLTHTHICHDARQRLKDARVL